MIELRAVTYHYPNALRPALDKVDLTINPAEFILLTGHSGSGKSTLLRAINGLVPHFSGGSISGEVLVNGVSVISAGPRALSRTAGFVNQNPENQSLLEVVEEEIAFPLEQAAVPEAEMQVRVTAVMELLDLLHLRDRTLATLSGGERQRAAIATALALQPQVLLLDEPTSQLDPDAAVEVLEALAQLNEALGLTIIIAEHRLERVIGYVGRVLLMADGRIQHDGTPRQLAAQLPHRPPLIEVGHALKWQPLPLTLPTAEPLAAAAVADLPLPSHRPTPEQSADAQIVLEVCDLAYAYGKREVLSGVNLRLYQGQALVVMGHNGSGKSTLLKNIVGLLTPAKGQVLLHGRSTAGQKTAVLARHVGMLPQNPDDLLFADTVTDELEVTLHNHGIAVPLESVPELLTRLGLAEVAAAYPRDLSSGQRQRVALGAVTVTRPGLILLDEPTRGLDGRFKQKMLDIWRGWLADGLSLLVVTHDVELAAQIADWIIVLDHGHVQSAGPPHQVLDGSSPFVTETARLFPGRGWLTPVEALQGLHYSATSKLSIS
jgi:energy-coupling factor transport system ATP-binding protein